MASRLVPGGHSVTVPLLEHLHEGGLDRLGHTEALRDPRGHAACALEALSHEFLAIGQEVDKAGGAGREGRTSRNVFRQPGNDVQRVPRVPEELELSLRHEFVYQPRSCKLARPGGAAGVLQEFGVVEVDPVFGREPELLCDVHGDVARADPVLGLQSHSEVTGEGECSQDIRHPNRPLAKR